MDSRDAHPAVPAVGGKEGGSYAPGEDGFGEIRQLTPSQQLELDSLRFDPPAPGTATTVPGPATPPGDAPEQGLTESQKRELASLKRPFADQHKLIEPREPPSGFGVGFHVWLAHMAVPTSPVCAAEAKTPAWAQAPPSKYFRAEKRSEEKRREEKII